MQKKRKRLPGGIYLSTKNNYKRFRVCCRCNVVALTSFPLSTSSWQVPLVLSHLIDSLQRSLHSSRAYSLRLFENATESRTVSRISTLYLSPCLAQNSNIRLERNYTLHLPLRLSIIQPESPSQHTKLLFLARARAVNSISLSCNGILAETNRRMSIARRRSRLASAL